jgi:hypothetical protein
MRFYKGRRPLAAVDMDPANRDVIPEVALEMIISRCGFKENRAVIG